MKELEDSHDYTFDYNETSSKSIVLPRLPVKFKSESWSVHVAKRWLRQVFHSWGFVQQGSLNADDVQVQENDEIVQEGQIDNQEPFVQNPMNEAEVYVHPPHEQDYVQEEHAQDFGQASQVNFHPPTLDPSGRYYWDYDQALWQPYHHNYETNYAPHDGQDDLTYTFTNL